MGLQHTFTERRNHEIRDKACLLTSLQNVKIYRKNDRPFCNIVLHSSNKYLYLNKTKHKCDIFTQEITPVEIGQPVAKVKLLIVASITALTPIIYNSVYSYLIATH